MATSKKNTGRKSVRRPAPSQTAANVTAAGAGGPTGSETIGTNTGNLERTVEPTAKQANNSAGGGKFNPHSGPGQRNEL